MTLNSWLTGWIVFVPFAISFFVICAKAPASRLQILVFSQSSVLSIALSKTFIIGIISHIITKYFSFLNFPINWHMRNITCWWIWVVILQWNFSNLKEGGCLPIDFFGNNSRLIIPKLSVPTLVLNNFTSSPGNYVTFPQRPLNGNIFLKTISGQNGATNHVTPTTCTFPNFFMIKIM